MCVSPSWACLASWAGYDGLGRWRAGEGLPARCSLSVSLYVSSLLGAEFSSGHLSSPSHEAGEYSKWWYLRQF